MPARRFFVRDRHVLGDVVAIQGSDAHKIAHVLRLNAGDAIEVIDSAGQLFRATLEREVAGVGARLDALLEVPDDAALRIDVAQGIPKGAKMDYVVEKLGELGVQTLLPLRSERTIASDVSAAKLARWRRLAHGASAQSGRRDILAVTDPIGWEELLARIPRYDAVLLPWEAAPREPLRERLPGLLARARRILLAIGPEGGFSHTEAEAAVAAGAESVSLGSTILRTETAALVAVAMVRYQCD
jgi:16S rRNA (uracil1498-N3)-methyltransferase